MIKRLLLWNEISAVRLLPALTCLYALALPGIGHAQTGNGQTPAANTLNVALQYGGAGAVTWNGTMWTNSWGGWCGPYPYTVNVRVGTSGYLEIEAVVNGGAACVGNGWQSTGSSASNGGTAYLTYSNRCVPTNNATVSYSRTAVPSDYSLYLQRTNGKPRQ